MRVTTFIVALLSGTLLGAGSALYFTSYAGVRPDLQLGAWEIYQGVGERDRSMYRRAFVARIAWFGLPASETIYATAHTDDQGAPLSDRCRYRVRGGPVDARWWSVTAYRNRHWMRVPSERYGLSSTEVATGPSGTWEIRLGQEPQPGDWLPIDNRQGDLSLIFRMYNPSHALAAGLRATKQLPSIERLTCRDS
jgi:hypothetical protein